MAENSSFRSRLRGVLPAPVLRWALRRRRMRAMGSTVPLSTCFGVDRGRPIDRYYIEKFLHAHAADVRGRVLEVGDRNYTTMLAGQHRVTSDILHFGDGNARATILGDLATGQAIPESAFECFICTQTLMFIYDVHGAIAHIHRLLKPGGVALVTVAGISHIARFDMEAWGDYWRFTSMSCQRLFSDVFGQANVSVQPMGNMFAASAMLHGLTQDELEAHELKERHRDYEVIIGVRAVRATEEART